MVCLTINKQEIQDEEIRPDVEDEGLSPDYGEARSACDNAQMQQRA
jgi:hypothetical protein